MAIPANVNVAINMGGNAPPMPIEVHTANALPADTLPIKD